MVDAAACESTELELERRVACGKGEVDLEEVRCVRTAEISLWRADAEETSRVLWSRAGVDGGGDVYGGSVSTAEASLREAESQKRLQRIL